jgi:hypothetical protein
VSIIAYDAGLADGREEGKADLIKLIEEMLVNPPMRGDIALSDLRRAVLEKWS